MNAIKKGKSGAIITFVAIYSVAAWADSLPLNPLVRQETIRQTVCVHGWTKTVRPPVPFTGSIKRKMMYDIGIPREGEQDITLDHRIPLALGGSPDDERNFMLQPDDESKDKDRVEVCLARSVCRGHISLFEAQQAIWSNWRTAGRLCAGYKVPLADWDR